QLEDDIDHGGHVDIEDRSITTYEAHGRNSWRNGRPGRIRPARTDCLGRDRRPYRSVRRTMSKTLLFRGGRRGGGRGSTARLLAKGAEPPHQPLADHAHFQHV